jgi:regulator of sirC expression with transglutaminase-like and TPR domain
VSNAGEPERAPAGKALFASLMSQPDDQVDLALAALLIAEEEYPELDRDRYLSQLDDLASQAHATLQPDMQAREVVEGLTQLLAWDHGFRGNQDDYYDPRNSFLNDVLDRRTGIPITLTTVYTEVGRRTGLAIQGVGFPAHFLARYQDVVFDPFNEGRILSEDDCRRLLAEVSSGTMTFRPGLLAPTPTKQIVARMLNNLKQIYLSSRYYRKAIGVMDRLLLVNPTSYGELRDRGAVYAELRQYGQAKNDLQTYLEHCTEPEEVLAIRQALQKIDNVVTLMDD